MFRIIFAVLLGINTIDLSAQNTDNWTTSFSNNEVSISTKYQDFDYPEKGISNRYLLLNLENKTGEELTISYDLDRSYNGKELTPDVNGFEFIIPANSSVEAQKDDLKEGLHLFAKMLNVEGKSSLSHFELSNLIVNGKTIEQ